MHLRLFRRACRACVLHIGIASLSITAMSIQCFRSEVMNTKATRYITVTAKASDGKANANAKYVCSEKRFLHSS